MLSLAKGGRGKQKWKERVNKKWKTNLSSLSLKAVIKNVCTFAITVRFTKNSIHILVIVI